MILIITHIFIIILCRIANSVEEKELASQIVQAADFTVTILVTIIICPCVIISNNFFVRQMIDDRHNHLHDSTLQLQRKGHC